MNNNEIIFLNDYIFSLKELSESDKIDSDIIQENFILIKESIIDKIENLSDDDFNELTYNSIIDDYEKKISDKKNLNQYIRIIKEVLESE